MPMRIVEPLDDEDWDKLVVMLEEGSSSEDRRKIMEEARKVGERFKIPE